MRRWVEAFIDVPLLRYLPLVEFLIPRTEISSEIRDDMTKESWPEDSPASSTDKTPIMSPMTTTVFRTRLTLLPRYTARTIRTTSVCLNAPAAQEEVDIRGKLKDALKLAMKGKDKEAVGTIRVSPHSPSETRDCTDSTRAGQSLMADITYHEKSGANPNEPANEDTVIQVLRKAVDKRVSTSAGMRR